MDILHELSLLLWRNAQELRDKDPEYKDLKHQEGRLFDQIPEGLRGKLIDTQTKIECRSLLCSFLYGVQVGRAASDLGQGG